MRMNLLLRALFVRMGSHHLWECLNWCLSSLVLVISKGICKEVLFA